MLSFVVTIPVCGAHVRGYMRVHVNFAGIPLGWFRPYSSAPVCVCVCVCVCAFKSDHSALVIQRSTVLCLLAPVLFSSEVCGFFFSMLSTLH